MESVFKRYVDYSLAFRNAMTALGLGFVALEEERRAVCLTAVLFPENIDGKKFLGFCKDYGVIFAGGLHKAIKTKYFRVGHMGMSCSDDRDDIRKCVEAIEYGLARSGYPMEGRKGKGVKAFDQVISKRMRISKL